MTRLMKFHDYQGTKLIDALAGFQLSNGSTCKARFRNTRVHPMPEGVIFYFDEMATTSKHNVKGGDGNIVKPVTANVFIRNSCAEIQKGHFDLEATVHVRGNEFEIDIQDFGIPSNSAKQPKALAGA